MLRRLSLLSAVLILAAPALAAVFPDQWGDFTKKSESPVAVREAALWNEYGLDTAVSAGYVSAAGSKFSAAAWRLKDSTSAMAVWQWQRPAGARPAPGGKLWAETPEGAFLAHGNYVFSFSGRKPKPEDLEILFGQLPRLEISSLPVLPDYLPADGRAANSERYVLGPAALGAFEPRIPPSVAAFHLGAEAQLGRFSVPGGELGLAIFNYPTPHVARDRQAQFQTIPGALVKRTGPMVAVILSPANVDEAERLLAKVNYQATITWSERIPLADPNIGDFLITAFTLVGLLLLGTLAAGAAFGGYRVLGRRLMGDKGAAEPFLRLHLEDR